MTEVGEMNYGSWSVGVTNIWHTIGMLDGTKLEVLILCCAEVKQWKVSTRVEELSERATTSK